MFAGSDKNHFDAGMLSFDWFYAQMSNFDWLHAEKISFDCFHSEPWVCYVVLTSRDDIFIFIYLEHRNFYEDEK